MPTLLQFSCIVKAPSEGIGGTEVYLKRIVAAAMKVSASDILLLFIK